MVSYAAISNPGGRSKNEDFWGVAQRDGAACFAVADGLGGHNKGEIASVLAVETALRGFRTKGLNSEYLSEAFMESQQALRSCQDRLGDWNDLKTTLILCTIARTEIQWGHVGDSRLYFFQDGHLKTRTLDHSIPQMLVNMGAIHEEQIRFHPDRNRLTLALGMENEQHMYEIGRPIPRLGKQALLLCTDGFWELISEEIMERELQHSNTVREWSKRMEKTVLRNGLGKEMDNYTAVCIWCI